MSSDPQQETVLQETREKVLKFIKQGQQIMETGINEDFLKMLNQYDSVNGTVHQSPGLASNDPRDSSLPTEPSPSSSNINTAHEQQQPFRNANATGMIVPDSFPIDLQHVKLDNLFHHMPNENLENVSPIVSAFKPQQSINPLQTTDVQGNSSPVKTLDNPSNVETHSPINQSFSHSSPLKMEVTLTPPPCSLPAAPMVMEVSQHSQNILTNNLPTSVETYNRSSTEETYSIQNTYSSPTNPGQTYSSPTNPGQTYNVHNTIEQFHVVSPTGERYNTENIECRDPLLSLSDVPLQNKSYVINPSPELPTFASMNNEEIIKPESCSSGSVLQKLLTQTNPPDYFDLTNESSPDAISSPDYPNADSPSSLSSPNPDPNTQATLIMETNRVHLDSDSDLPVNFKDIWNLEDDHNKAMKMYRDSDAPTSLADQSDVNKVFDADAASNKLQFEFQKFGKDDGGDLFCNVGSIKTDHLTPSPTLLHSPDSLHLKDGDMPPPKAVVVTRSQTQSKRVKEPSLNQYYSVKVPGYEIQIQQQPEEQHRARYLTEGSRGAVKTRSQEGHPMVKLCGNVDSAVLQVFIGNDAGKTKPHGFYQACRVSGKNSTPAREKDVDGTTVIEMDLTAVSDMTATIDNVGILKLRNADVEQRIGLTKAKKKSTKARMIFRVMFKKADGSPQTLQISSSTILCTQPVGQPEICKVSRHNWSVVGKEELFLIGKNFIKGTKVVFRETSPQDDSQVIWEQDADIDKDYFQPTHLICTIPPYKDPGITKAVTVQVVVQSAGKQSDPHKFVYTPEVSKTHLDPPVAMEEGEVSHKRKLSFTVSPEAIELQQQIQQTSSGIFVLPPGTIPPITSQSDVTSMQVDPITRTTTASNTDNLKTVDMFGGVGISSPITSGPMEQQQSEATIQSLLCSDKDQKPTTGNEIFKLALEEMKSLQQQTASQQSPPPQQLLQQQVDQKPVMQQISSLLQDGDILNFTPQTLDLNGGPFFNPLPGAVAVNLQQQQPASEIQQQQQHQPMSLMSSQTMTSQSPQTIQAAVQNMLQQPLQTTWNQQQQHCFGDLQQSMAVQQPAGSLTGNTPSLQSSPAFSFVGTSHTNTMQPQAPVFSFGSTPVVSNSMAQQVSSPNLVQDIKPTLPSLIASFQSSAQMQAPGPVSSVAGQQSLQSAWNPPSQQHCIGEAQSAPTIAAASPVGQISSPQIIICGSNPINGFSNNINGLIGGGQQIQLPVQQSPQQPQQSPQQPQQSPQQPQQLPQQPQQSPQQPQQPPQQSPQQQQQASAALGPIVILPGGMGGCGNNQQVENILRSIISSLSNQQAPQPQPPQS